MKTLCECEHRREVHGGADVSGPCIIDDPITGPCECMKFREDRFDALPEATPALHVIATFEESELSALEQVIAKLLAGGDARVLARSPAFASITKKVAEMRRSLKKGAA